jgi:hypothetical protein
VLEELVLVQEFEFALVVVVEEEVEVELECKVECEKVEQVSAVCNNTFEVFDAVPDSTGTLEVQLAKRIVLGGVEVELVYEAVLEAVLEDTEEVDFDFDFD